MLVDRADKTQLNDMKLAVEYAFEYCGYELTVLNFELADDEVIDEM